MIVAVIILFIAVIGGMIGLTIWKIKQTDPSNIDTSKNSQIDTAQEFLPFDDIRDGVIHLGNHQYRAVIECGSINYDLRTESEKDIIEMSYQGFLNSLSHPISILNQTRTVDNTKMLNNLSNDIEKVKEIFPQLSEYGNLYYQSMEMLPEQIGNNKQKKKYIIVPYNEAINLTNSTEEEKYIDSLKELQNRCQIICDGLVSIGINCKILNTGQLIDLMYSSYHKDEANQADNILSGDFLSMVVDGENKLSNITDEGKLDFIIYETQLRLQTELANENGVSQEIKDKANTIITTLDSLRKELAGYYKTDVTKKNDDIHYF